MTGPIYTVTVFDPDRDWSHRTWCWFPTKEEAVALLHEGGDLLYEDGSYQYAVVETVPPGWENYSRWDCWWFRITMLGPGQSGPNSYIVEALDGPPEEMRDICCFSMG